MHVEKEAGGKIRRVTKVKVEFYCPAKFSEDIEKKLEDAEDDCPVHHSLHPDLVQEFHFHWGVS